MTGSFWQEALSKWKLLLLNVTRPLFTCPICCRGNFIIIESVFVASLPAAAVTAPANRGAVYHSSPFTEIEIDVDGENIKLCSTVVCVHK